jgi:NAD+ synthase (glutamine-hydrolysing)
VRIIAAQINPTVGDVEGNTRKILDGILRARNEGADLVLFPELALSGYPPEDLLLDSGLIDALWQKLPEIGYMTKGLMAVVGVPRWNSSKKEKSLFNSAAVFQDGDLIGFHNKQLLPTYDVFDERRFFEPGETPTVFTHQGKKVAVTICEDLWQHSGLVGYTDYRVDPVAQLQEQEVDLILNLSSSPYYLQREQTRVKVFSNAAKAVCAPLLFCNQVGANDELVFDGRSMFFNEWGELMQIARGFVEEDLIVDLAVRSTSVAFHSSLIGDLYHALILGVRDYFIKQGFRKALLGLSGGIDSAVVACIGVAALGSEHLSCLYLPSRFSAHSNEANIALLAERLSLRVQKVGIETLFQPTLQLLEPLFQGKSWDETEENMQARIRCQILMAFSNKFGTILLNASNKSEIAMGYTTLYGDLCGGLGVLQDVTKTRVFELARFINREKEIIPAAIIQKIPSAELRENQSDQDTLPPFELLDPVIEDYIEERLSPREISHKRTIALPVVEQLVATIHRAEYKRRQTSISIRVTQKAFSKGRMVPIVQRWKEDQSHTIQ